jgi:ubiquitin-conjugating enzyme E2 Q
MHGLTCLDVASYPTESSFMLWTDTPGVPQAATDVLEDIAAASAGVQLPDLVANISRKLQRALANGAKNDPLIIEDDVEMLDAEASGDATDDSYDEYGFGEHFGLDGGVHGQNSISSAKISMAPEAGAKINKRIRQDLRAAKFAGFSAGILSGMKADSVNRYVQVYPDLSFIQRAEASWIAGELNEI